MPTGLPEARPGLDGIHDVGRAMERLRARSGSLIAFGLVLMVLGALALYFVATATIATVYANGVFMTLAGFAEMVIGYQSRTWGRFFLWMLAGVLYVVAGVFAMLNPTLGALIFTLLLAAGLLAAGIVRLVLAFHLPAGQARWLIALSGALAVALGLMIWLGWPSNSLFVLGTLLGIDLIWYGVSWVSLGFRLRAHS